MSMEQSRNNRARQLQIATLGGGCFWCMEAVFDEINGVVKVESGYSGGALSNPTYEEVVKQLNSAKIVNDPIVTQIKPFRAFYKAEKYHDKYFKGHPEQPYCRVIIAPKIAKLRKQYFEKI